MGKPLTPGQLRWAAAPKGAHCYPVDQDARRAHLAAKCPPPARHPAPEVPARLATPEEIPTGAKRLIKAAKVAGWTVVTTYARGTALVGAGRPAKVVESVMVALRRRVPWSPFVPASDADAPVPAPDVERAVATWTDGAFDLAYVSRRFNPSCKVGARELRTIVDLPAGRVAP